MDWGAVAGAATGGLTSIAGGIINSNAAKNAATRDRNFQREMFHNSNVEYNKRLTDQRAYDDPKAWASRMTSANANPALMYGGANGTTVSQTPPSPSAGAGSSERVPDLSGITNLGQNIAGTMLTLTRAKSEQNSINLQNANIALASAKALREQAATAKTEVERDLLLRQADSIAAQAAANVQKTLAETENTQQRTVESKSNVYLNEKQKDYLDSQLDLNRSRIRNIDMDTALKDVGISLTSQQILESNSRISVNYSQVQKLLAEVGVIKSEDQIREMEASLSKMGLHGRQGGLGAILKMLVSSSLSGAKNVPPDPDVPLEPKKGEPRKFHYGE